jgi:hypothetical protein
MKALGFGQWTSAGFSSRLSDGAGERENGRIESAYMAMSDYLLLTAELPSGGEEEIVSWVSKNLPRFFPDEPDKHPFDVLPRAVGSGRSRQVLFTSAECLSEYRKAFPGVPLASIITAFREPEGDFARVVAMPGWIEWASKEGGVWTLGERIDASASMRTALSLILSDLAERTVPLHVQLIYDPVMENDLAGLADGEGVLPLPFLEAFDPRRARKLSHFDRETKHASSRVRATLVIGAAAALFIAANVLLLGAKAAYSGERRKNLAILKEIKAAQASDKALIAERDALLSSSGAAVSFPSAQSLLASLSAGLGAKARLIDIIEENGSFTANIESPNALASLAALESSGNFEGLKISGIKAGDSGERFCLTGRYHEKR